MSRNKAGGEIGNFPRQHVPRFRNESFKLPYHGASKGIRCLGVGMFRDVDFPVPGLTQVDGNKVFI